MADWSPDQYARFKAERRQPFLDLLALVRPGPAMRVADLGCGPGELTRELHAALGAAQTVGLDSSPAMLSRAAAHAGGGVSFERADIGAFAGLGARAPASPGPDAGGLDLIFANAALHWVPDHPALLARLSRALAPGGQLAVQVPANESHPSHRIANEVAAEAPFAEALGGHQRTSPVLPPRDYAELLHALGFAEQHVRLAIYGHELPAAEDVVAWVRGSLLTDFERRMPSALFRDAFVPRYGERLLAALGPQRPYFYTYPRVLLWGRMPGGIAAD
jgi:trans-aconitate 2-methyltransferase